MCPSQLFHVCIVLYPMRPACVCQDLSEAASTEHLLLSLFKILERMPSGCAADKGPWCTLPLERGEQDFVSVQRNLHLVLYVL